MSETIDARTGEKYHGTEKLFCSAAMSFYALLYAELRIVARSKGYALALHGSLRRDLDVLAVPWTEDAADEIELVKALTVAAEGLCDLAAGKQMPHGRTAWVIQFPGVSATIHPDERGTYIDLSVMQKSTHHTHTP